MVLLNAALHAQICCNVSTIGRWAYAYSHVSVNKCRVLNVEKIIHNTCFGINGAVLPVVDSTRDL